MRRWGSGAAFLLGLAVGIYSQWSGLNRPYVVNNDARQHTYWMAQWQDPELFANDPITEYAKAFQPWGYVGLYRAAAPLVPPLTFGKLLPSLTLGLAALFFYLLGLRLAGPFGGALAAVWVVVTPIVVQKMAGGHARAFAIPLLAAFLLFLIERAYKSLALTLALQALFYPMVLLMSLGTAGLCLVRRRDGHFELDRRLAAALLVGGLASGLLVIARQAGTEATLGPIAHASEIRGQPEAGREGFFPLDPSPPLVATAGREARQVMTLLPAGALAARPAEGTPWHRLEVPLAVALAGLLAAGWWFGLAIEVPALVVAGIVLFRLADLFILRLYVPVRYLQYPLRVGLILALSWLLATLLARLPAVWPRRIAQALVLGVLLVHAPGLAGIGLENHGANRGLFEFLQAAPKSILVAAHPHLADDIQLFASRRVLIDFEHVQPFYPRFWRSMRGRTSDFFAAYYAASLPEVCGFLERWKVDYLVIDRRQYAARFIKSRRLYPEPFRSEIRERIGTRRRFALDGVPETATVFHHGAIDVVTPASLGCLEAAPGASPPPAGREVAPPGS